MQTKIEKSFLVVLALIMSIVGHTQTIEFQGTIKLSDNSKVYKNITVSNCPIIYQRPLAANGATKETHVTKYTNGKTEISIEDTVTHAAGAGNHTINADELQKADMMPYASGKANLFIDEKDKSILYVNYWLGKKRILPIGTYIKRISAPSYICGAKGVATPAVAGPIIHLTKAEECNWQRINAGNIRIGTPWINHFEQIIVYKSDGITVDYHLVNRYDLSHKYILDLPNRIHIPYHSPSVDLTALTIPFKYRFGYKKDTLSVKDDVAAGFNIGVFAGYKLTRYSIINRGGTYINRTTFSFRAGPFLNVSTAALDSVTTTAGDIPMKKDDKQNIAIISTGVGGMLDIKGVQLGVYGGWDFATGPEARNWNYHRRFWLGFGVGYKITDLFKQKE